MNRSLAPTYERFAARSKWIEDFVLRGNTLDALSQRLVGELAILYLAISMEQSIEEICLRVCCGASYLDGSVPFLNKRCKSIENAADQLRVFGRQKKYRIQYLKWLNAVDISGNVKHVIQVSDPIFKALAIHSETLDVVRIVRNHVAHRSKSTRDQYRKEVQKIYGPISKALEPGIFLMSPRLKPPLINSLIIRARVLIKDITRG